MKDRNRIYNIYITDFDSFKNVQEVKNPNFITTEESIKQSIIETKNRFINRVPEVVLNEEE